LTKWNKFAEDYHNKRKKPWNDLISFINKLRKNSYQFAGLNLDLGCANGRHFKIFKNDNNKIVGIDNSIEFLKIAQQKIKKIDSNKIDLILADITKLPIRKKRIDNIFSIAALHHIKSYNQRKETFNSLNNILKPEGLMLITVWRRWQKRFRFHFFKDWIKRKLNPYYKKKQIKKGLIEFGDIYVPWTVSSEDITINRFYHLISKKELRKLLNEFNILKLKKRGGPGEKDNFFVLAKRKIN